MQGRRSYSYQRVGRTQLEIPQGPTSGSHPCRLQHTTSWSSRPHRSPKERFMTGAPTPTRVQKNVFIIHFPTTIQELSSHFFLCKRDTAHSLENITKHSHPKTNGREKQHTKPWLTKKMEERIGVWAICRKLDGRMDVWQWKWDFRTLGMERQGERSERPVGFRVGDCVASSLWGL